MEDTPKHTYQILTKRPERMAEILSGEKPAHDLTLLDPGRYA